MKSLALFVALFLGSAATAAPKVDTLFPGGGQRGTSVEVAVSGTFENWPPQAWASHLGIKVIPGKVSGKATFTIAANVPCGVHWVRFFDTSGASGLRPFLVNQLVEIEEKEPNDDFKKPHEIAHSAVIVNGRLAKNDDVDHFAVSLKKGQTLVAAAEAFRTLRSPMDAVLQIISPDGFVLAQNDDYDEIDPLLAFEAPKDGVYLVRLFCFPATTDSRVGFFGKETCIYRLTLTTGPFIDRTWPLAVERNQPSKVELLGWNIPAESRNVSVNSATKDARVFLQPPSFANGKAVRIESHRVLMSAAKIGLPPVSVSDRLAKPGSRAAFTFDGLKGKTLSITIEARDRQLPLDAVLSIRNTAGKVLQKSQAAKLNVDPTMDFVPPEDGSFTLEVRDLHDEGGPRHSFLARIRPTLPRFEVSIAADRFEGKTKQPLEVSIVADFRYGMKGSLEFRAEGLPESARLEFVLGKDPKKSTLRIHGLDTPVNAPIRLLAQANDQAEQAVIATEWNVPHLWITANEK